MQISMSPWAQKLILGFEQLSILIMVLINIVYNMEAIILQK